MYSQLIERHGRKVQVHVQDWTCYRAANTRAYCERAESVDQSRLQFRLTNRNETKQNDYVYAKMNS